MANFLFFDIESHNAGKQYGMSPREFGRLYQYAWNDGPVVLTEDYDEMIRVIREADYVVGHNIISFDLSVLFGVESLEALYMAMNRKVIDTYYLANLLTPAPYAYTNKQGAVRTAAAKPIEHAMSWLGLENLCFQFGLEGKFGSLRDLAKKYNPPKTLVADLDYSLIPLDDPDFRAYAEQDVPAMRGLYHYLIAKLKRDNYPGEYVWREMELMSATVGQMARNGILVNQEYANERISEMATKREEVMAWLVENYDFPTTGKNPWATDKGKEVILQVLADFGITPETRDWPRNAPSAKSPEGSLKMGGEELKMLAEGASPEAMEFVEAIASLKGMRTIPQLVMESMKEDGRVHPEISSLQRSGRWSFTKPGVTIFGERSEALKADKALFVAAEGNVLAGFDYSSADARAMAALSGDDEFARRFETDAEGEALHDAHNLTGEAMFGKEPYWKSVDDKGKPTLRPVAKIAGHAQNYNVGGYKLANTLNEASKKEDLGLTFWAPANTRYGQKEIPFFEDSLLTRDMISAFNEAYPWLKRFKDRSVEEGESGIITNSWGRRMKVDEGSAYTQGPALYGQSTTREIMGDAILKLIRRGDYYIRALRAIIHDELLVELDETRVEEDIKVIKECMEIDFDPKTNVSIVIPFPVGYGYGKTWKEAGH